MLPLLVSGRQRLNPMTMSLGEGVMSSPFASESGPVAMNGVVSLTIAVSVVAVVALALRFFEFAGSESPHRESFLLKWSAPREQVLSLGSTAELIKEGENSREFESLEEAIAALRQIQRQSRPTEGGIYRVRGFAVTQNAALKDEVKSREETDLQKIWDAELQNQAEEEAADMRTDVDDKWTDFKRKNLDIGQTMKNDGIEIVKIGGQDGAAPCPLCNGKGQRIRFKTAYVCDWCQGSGINDGNEDGKAL